MKIETVPCPLFSFLKLELSIPHHPLGAQKEGVREGGEGRWTSLSISGSCLVHPGFQMLMTAWDLHTTVPITALERF